MSIVHIASTAKGSADSTAATTDAIDTTGADLLVVAVAWYTASAVFSPSDSLANVWTPLTKYSAGEYSIKLYYRAAPTVGAAHTFTVSSSGTYPAIGVVAVSGAHASPFASETGNTGTGLSSIQPGSVTPPENNCLVITALAGDRTAPAVDSPFATATGVDKLNAAHVMLGLSRYIQSTAGALNPTWTWAGGADAGSAATAAVFKSADPSAGGGPSGYLTRHRLSGGLITMGGGL